MIHLPWERRHFAGLLHLLGASASCHPCRPGLPTRRGLSERQRCTGRPTPERSYRGQTALLASPLPGGEGKGEGEFPPPTLNLNPRLEKFGMLAVWKLALTPTLSPEERELNLQTQP